MTDERAIEVLNIMKSQMNYFGATVRYGGVKEMQEQAVDCALKALSEIQQYRAIGTVKECRAAAEKQRAKKPLSRTHCKDGNHPLSQDIGRCPTCNGIVVEDMIWCDDCGQKLDWSDTP